MDLSINEGTLVVTGGPGHTLQTAIVIRKTPRGLSAAGAEQLLLAQRCGRYGSDWTLARQTLVTHDGRVFDEFHILMAGGGERVFFFDVTDWLTRIQQDAGSGFSRTS